MRTVVLIACSIIVMTMGLIINDDQEYAKFIWPEGKIMAISLTFDDSRASQIDKCIPVLDKYGIRGTFYVLTHKIDNNIQGWKKAAADGHEIGNHSLMHICSVNLESKNEGLEYYTLERMKQELNEASRIIEEKLGTKIVSFAYPCGETFVGKGTETKSYVPLIATMFETGRGWLSEAPNDPLNCDMAQLMGMKLDGLTFENVRTLIQSTKKTGRWLILAGHDIGEDSTGLSTHLATLEQICKYAADPANGIWIDNVHNIASYIRAKRGEPFEKSVADNRSSKKGIKKLSIYLPAVFYK